MKKKLVPALNLGIILLFFNSLACHQLSLTKREPSNQSLYVKDMIIKDETGKNQIELRLSSLDSDFLNSYSSKPWKLIELPLNTGGPATQLPESFADESPFQTITAKLHIEILRKSFEAEIGVFYIEDIHTDAKEKQALIESEFISEIESFGGSIQFSNPKTNANDKIIYHAETIDDLSVIPISGEYLTTKESSFGVIDFSDHKGMIHAWRVRIRHDISIFPIVRWSNNVSSKFP